MPRQPQPAQQPDPELEAQVCRLEQAAGRLAEVARGVDPVRLRKAAVAWPDKRLARLSDALASATLAADGPADVLETVRARREERRTRGARPARRPGAEG